MKVRVVDFRGSEEEFRGAVKDEVGSLLDVRQKKERFTVSFLALHRNYTIPTMVQDVEFF